MTDIRHNVEELLKEIPRGVQLVAAAKTRLVEEVTEAVDAGIRVIGENYVQEARAVYPVLKDRVKWHFIGHLQKNKVKRAVELFDMIETVDSLPLAEAIDKQCRQIDKVMPVLIEVNSGREEQKAGVFPEDTENLIRNIAKLTNVSVMGLMTMGPVVENPESLQPYFRETRELYDNLRQLDIPNVDIRYLSMGMTDSYQLAIHEGANIVRIGSKIFGQRSY